MQDPGDFVRVAGKPKLWGQVDQLERGTWRRIWPARAAEAEKAVKFDDRNHVRIRCVGQRLTGVVNGVVTLDETIDKLPKEGAIGFRCMVAEEFLLRDIRVRKLSAPTSHVAEPGPQPPFQPLFNGKDFTGWVLEGFPKSRNVKEDWPIADNAVECFQRFGILRTGKAYSDYVFQTEFMFPEAELEGDDSLGKARLELLVHLADPTASRPPYIKVNLDMDGECEMGPATESGLKHVKSRVIGKRLAIKEWHKLMIVVKREVVEVFVNGQPMGKMTDAAPGKGHFALSPTGMPTLYRNIEIKELPPSRGTVILHNPAAFDVLASFYRIEGERRELVKEFQPIKKGKESSFDLDVGDYEVRGMKLGGGPETAWQQRVSVTGGEPSRVVFQPEPAFEPLFNGKDLSGWVSFGREVDVKTAWPVEDKILRRTGAGSHLRTEKKYRDYVLEIEFRHAMVENPFAAGLVLGLHVGEMNPEKIERGEFRLKLFQSGVGKLTAEAGASAKSQVGGSTLSFRAKLQPIEASGWDRLTITSQGGTLEVAINGESMGKLTHCAPREGCLALLGGLDPLEFRNIRIAPLPAPEPTPEPR